MLLSGLITSAAVAKPGTRVEIDYGALDAVVTAELKDKHTPGAVIVCLL